MSGFRIVTAETCEQVRTFRMLCLEYAQSLSFELCFQNFEAELDSLPHPYAPPQGVILLADHEQGPAGCVAVKPLGEPGVCELKRLWVRPDFRRSGCARSLISQALKFAGQTNYRVMRLDTVSEMVAAIRLYKSFGFREVPAYTHNPLPEATYYERDIAPR
jgi:putative acetyltransferase